MSIFLIINAYTERQRGISIIGELRPCPRRNLNEMLHVLGEHTGMKLSCIKPTSKVRGLSIEPHSSTGCID